MSGFRTTVVLLGDSQGQGLAPHLASALTPEYVLRATSVEAGISTAAIASTKLEPALTLGPDVVLVVAGGNDGIARTDPARYERTLRAFAKRVRDAGARLVWVGPSVSRDVDVDARHRAAGAIQARVLPTEGALWIDARAYTTTGHAGDGVHFTTAAYGQQAAELGARVKTALALSAVPAGPTVALLTGVGVVVGVLVGAVLASGPSAR